MKKSLAKKIFAPFALLLVLAVSACQISTENSSSNDNSTGAGTSSPHSSSCLKDSEQNNESSGNSESSESSELPSQSSAEQEIVTDALSIHFPFVGNKSSGDCTLIKVGNTEVLIDAGSTKGSAATIVPYIQEFCTDGILEYVIATHAHEDHIAAFVGSSTSKGIFESFVCETIIDFPKTKATSQIYNNYVTYRNNEVASGATHYTALECWDNENGAQKSYTLGENVTMNILYQKYYEESTSNENNNSVCVMVSQEDKHFLFTGDLEHSGKKSLIESNNLPKCALYKAGHHGSNTASSSELLSVIQPERVVACCCCGDTYKFPHQEFLDNIAPYTDKLYIQAMVSGSTYKLLNGNIVLSSDGKEVTVNCSNNNTLFKDTDWFKQNRTLPQAWQS